MVIAPTTERPEGTALMLLDIDGTLMVGNRASGRVARALEAVRGEGCLIAVASGRPPSMVPAQLRDPQLVSCLMCCNGAVITDVTGAPLMEHGLERTRALEAMRALEPLRPAWNAFLPGGAFFEWGCFSYLVMERGGERPARQGTPHDAARGILAQGRATLGRARRCARRLYDDRHTTSRVWRVMPLVQRASVVYKLGCTLPTSSACDDALAALVRLSDLEVARVSPVELEITSSGADKGSAGLWIARQCGASRAQTVGFGDSENDLPLRVACGTFVAMGNASERVRDDADETCEPVWEDGVARWIERELGMA